MRQQNTSHAVMMRRQAGTGNDLDDYPTPPWATRALCEWLAEFQPLHSQSCREPAANRGYMVKALQEYFPLVVAGDIHDYGAGYPVTDFLTDDHRVPVDWTITNPPFRLAEPFIAKAVSSSDVGAAMLIRTTFLEGKGRYQRLFQTMPPSFILQFTERVVMHRGRLTATGSTATAYAWFVWLKGQRRRSTEIEWIAPCRDRLEREVDYSTATEPPTQ